ncbi:MAG: hypothetical protein L0H12_02650 [Nitrosospira sp.]|nr:hypothetical protein [Nitrosospira sp.]
MHLLGGGQLFVAAFEYFLKLSKLTRLVVQFGGVGKLCFSGFVGNNAGTFGIQLRGDPIGYLIIQRASGLGDFFLFFSDTLFAPGDLVVFL